MKQSFVIFLQRLGAALGSGWRRLICWLFNLRRRLLRKRLADYPVLVLDREIEERSPATPWWHGYVPGRKTPLTLEEISHDLQRIAGDPDVKGVILLVKGAAQICTPA